MEKRAIGTFLVSMVALLLPGCGEDDGAAPPQPSAMLVPLLADAPPLQGANLASAISGDGRVVVGVSDSSAGLQAFRWVTGATPEALGFLPGYTQESDANGTNADGSVIVGESMSAESSRAFIWTSERGLEPLGNLPVPHTRSGATGVSADGSVIVGYALSQREGEPEVQLGFVWTAQQGFTLLGDFLPASIPGTRSIAHGVSADGEVVVGEARHERSIHGPLSMAFRWTRTTGLFPLGWLYDAQPMSGAYTASADGSVIGGQSVGTGDPPLTEPMRWTPETSMVTLGRGFIGTARATSADGTKMAGGAADPGTAFLWDTENGYRNLLGVLQESGLDSGLEGHSPVTVYGMSADGTIVVGSAFGRGTTRGFVISLP